jgi:hypothetical protein
VGFGMSDIALKRLRFIYNDVIVAIEPEVDRAAGSSPCCSNSPTAIYLMPCSFLRTR